jgi:cyclopropane fatty-acyl-phospholipid synthase-like methyltransferase
LKELNLYAVIEQDLDFQEEIAKLYDAYSLLISQIEPSTLLDIGCGQGDFISLIQEQNIQTFGIDLSSHQIEVCQNKNISSACIDICEVKDSYDMATAVFDVLNYIPANRLKQFCTCTYDRLNPNGYFIFDINSLYGFEDVAQGTLSINKKDRFINIDAFFEDTKLRTTITLFDKKQNNNYTKQQNTIIQYYHTQNDIKKILQDIGFDIENIINFHLHDENNSDKWIFICKKS